MEAGCFLPGVELEPGGARVAVTRLPDAPGIDQPVALAEVEQRSVGGLGALDIGRPREEERDMGMADQAHLVRVGFHAGLRLVGGEHVLPDGVAGRSVKEADVLSLRRRVQLPEEVQGPLGDVLLRPDDGSRGRLRERGDIKGSKYGQVVVADQAEVAALADEIGARVRLRPVADHVSQAPDLLDTGLLDLLEDGLQGREVGVDIGDGRNPHGGQRTLVHPGPYDGLDEPVPVLHGAAEAGDEAMNASDSVAELRQAVDRAALKVRGSEARGPVPSLDRPPKPELGDYSSNAAMLLAASLQESPRDVAGRIGAELEQGLGDRVERIEVAGPGFVNLFLADDWYRQAAAGLASAETLGPAPTSSPQRMLVEFVSANPTGPLHVGGGRHAAYGDALVRLLQAVGHDAQREYYVNDAGGQIDRFAASLAARMTGGEMPEDGYEGAYVSDLAQQLTAEGVDSSDTEALGRRGVELVLEQVRATLDRFGVAFDNWFSERSLYESGEVEAALARLEQGGHTYRSEDALWLRSTEFGDDKDRVLVRANREPTYLAADVAYHWDKLERGYDRLINVLGADHHGYAPRVRAAIAGLGADPDRFEALIMRLVHIVEEGERAQMSKRSGDFVSLDELIDDIGVDACRWFMLWRSHDTTVDLDLDLARRESSDNPVYYVQYAHARIASILRKAGSAADGATAGAPTPGTALQSSEKNLIKRLLEFPDEVREAAERRAPHRVCAYSTAVAADFHSFYRDCQVIDADGEGVQESRLALCLLTKRTIAGALGLLGISAPEKM